MTFALYKPYTMILFTVQHIHRWETGNGYTDALIELAKDIKLIYKQNQQIMDTQKDLAKKMDAHTERLVKIGAESTKTLEELQKLKEVIANQPNVDPELQAAFDRAEAQAKVVDDLTPDAEVTPPVEGEGSGL